MRIALASASVLPRFESDDDHLVAALTRRGHEARYEIWNDPDVAWEQYECCLLRRTWDYCDHHLDFLRWVEAVKERTRLLNPAGMVRWNSDKAYLLELRDKGIAIAPTVEVPPEDAPELETRCAELAAEEAFLKPRIGQTSYGTLRFACDAAGRQRAEEHLRQERARGVFLLQPFLPSVLTEGELSLIFIDHRFSHAVRKVPPAGDYRVQDDFGATDHRCDPARDELVLAHDVMAQVPDALYARVDLLRDLRGKPVLNELELIEPSLFFRHDPAAAERLAEALVAWVQRPPTPSLKRG